MSCVHCGILEAKVKLLNDECAKLSTESTSQTCRRQHIQLCFMCEDIDCCDNMSPLKARFQALEAELADANRKLARYQLTRDILKQWPFSDGG